ncbi:MAG: type II toxin-antitoxin system RelE/ParE family toxin [Candidatus Nanoarchaeia archaeon]
MLRAKPPHWMMYKAILGPQAKKFLKKADSVVKKRIVNEIRELEQNPFPQEIERVVSRKGRPAFRTRVGDWRVQYVVLRESSEILVFKIEKRPRAY